MSLWQAIGLIILATIEILSFYLIISTIERENPLFFIIFGINYVFLIFLIIDYLILTFGDPSDPRLANPSYKECD